ncbi:MAG: hemin receptor [Ignavibacterium sp.]|nr:MAG: hemin receptor [Ignavibacterium sp.]
MLYRNIQLTLVVIIFSTLTFSQNYNDALRVSVPWLGASARALGMGNSYISLSDDGSASFFNPAGLGLVKKLEFMGGIDITSFNNSTKFFNQTTESNSSQTKLDNISLTFPIPTLRGSLVFGLSYNTTKDFVRSLEFNGFNNGSNSKIQSLLDTDIPYDLYLTDDNGNTIINGRLNQSGNMLNSGSLNQWTLTGAIEAYRNLFIGANVSVVSGSFTSDFDYYEDDTQNIYQGETAPGYPSTTDFRTFYLKNLLKWDIEGWNAKVGFLYQFEKIARLGLTIQFPKVYKINEDFNVEGRSEFANASVTLDPEKYSDKVKYDITSPYEISGGASVNLKGLIVSAQATYIDYKEMEFSNGEGISSTYFSDQNKRIKNLMRPVVNYNLGAEYTFPEIGFRLRGGFILQPSAFKNDPSDFDKKYLTAGVGFLSDGVIGIDIAYAYGWWKDVGDNYDSNVSRTFQDITYHKVMLTTSYRF